MTKDEKEIRDILFKLQDTVQKIVTISEVRMGPGYGLSWMNGIHEATEDILNWHRQKMEK